MRGDPSVPLSRWRPDLRRTVLLVVGLWLFGTGEGLLVVAGVGNSPWTVLAQGLSERSGATIGEVSIVLGAAVLLLWLPLRQPPGLGTVTNVVLVGVAIDVTVAVVPPVASFALGVVVAVAGIVVVGLGSGLYLGTGLGPGPRDGLMTGLHRRTGWPLPRVRWGIEGTVLIVGILLGGTTGVGTVLFALLIGPVVGLAVRALSRVPSVQL